eukprot:10343374-Lingulodinium_polyedra.AAC.1
MLCKPEGGVRPVGLLPSLYRLWACARGWVSKAWERGPAWRDFFWGSSGRGALDSAWLQGLEGEHGAAAG